MSKEPDDLDVPARLADGWAYVVSLVGGERRYLHSTLRLSQVRALHAAAIKEGALFLDFDGARFDPEGTPECAGYVIVNHILSVGYADPIASLEVAAAIRRQDALMAEVDAEEKGGGEGNEKGGAAPAGQAPAEDEETSSLFR